MDNERNEVVAAEQATEAKAPEAAAQRPAQRPFNRRRKKVCLFCADKIDYIDYKDTNRLKKFVTERARFFPAVSPVHALSISVS